MDAAGERRGHKSRTASGARPKTRQIMGSGPSTRNVVRIALAVAGTALSLYLLYLIRSVLQLILLAVFVAFWLGPFVEFLNAGASRGWSRSWRRTSRCSCRSSSSVWVVPPIANQIDKGVRQLPAGISKLRENATFRKYDNKYKITLKLENEAGSSPAGSRASRRSSPQ